MSEALCIEGPLVFVARIGQIAVKLKKSFISCVAVPLPKL